MSESYVWLSSLLIGVGVAVGAYSCRDYFPAVLDAVERDLAAKLRRLRASTRHLRKLLLFWLAVTACVFFGIWIALGSLLLPVISAAMLLAVPWYLLYRMAERHRRKIEDQLAGSMVTLGNAVKAGLSLAQAMEMLAAQCPRPINAEFHQISAEYKLGRPLQQTLVEAKGRLQSENFALFAAAVLAAHESGGKLNETVDRIAQSVREMQRLERKVRSETAQARKSAIYMAMVPAFVLVVYYFVDPVSTALLFTKGGSVLLAAALILNVVAYLWAYAILNPDI